MIRLALLLLALLAAPISAQDVPVPIVETVLDQAEVVPGQSVTLRLNILVPTWMPNPPDLPTFEAANLRVRRPANGSTAISRSIDGATWSGVSRRYLLTPMVPGEFLLPPQTIALTYAGAESITPVEASVVTDPIMLTGILPEGAEGLDPFIAAKALELTQELSAPVTDLAPGTSVIRTVTARIEGASPIVLPPLLAPVDIPAVRIYPDMPQVSEEDDGKTLSGSRVESETIMALGGGTGNVPAIRLDWFNLSTGTVERTEVPGFDISVSGPPVQAEGARGMRNGRQMLALAAAGLALLLILHRLAPRALLAMHEQRAAYLSSERYARKMLLRAVRQHDYPVVTHWLGEWRVRLTYPESAAIPELMARIGASVYRQGRKPPAAPAWTALDRAVRATGQVNADATSALSPLNPRCTSWAD
ncbi:MAG: hypothetical protein ACK5LJ_04990 [Paracoccus sp. (in: a-proteobacteria)]